ncbi:hypothetical protein SAMN05216203_2290 [Marinobacter daqiaonensis]|uniref:Soluble cytochrome b562 n=1 Tax=Marinobacter daqiaonensis TaxID=650891 RepID=A0A1I6II02_9GAMM|nr:DUF6746 family protein [Marinobacter daqiaonensis]SFR65950.1 hypothetical protein SAMN05216203_2290 [Marinobacter daqiaonensis]
MKQLFCCSALVTSMVFSGLSLATEVEHYEGKSANSLPEAVTNFSEYNEKLEKVLQGELTPEDLNEIHQLTYTLENAIARMEEELEHLAETLEEVHLASESANTGTVSEQGSAYLEKARQLIE